MSDLSDKIQATIDTEPVVAFIKGTHEQCMCGNSERALQALRSVGASFTAVDVLPDPAIRQELSALSSWPTIPQVFVGGELVGGADIVQELSMSGELEAKLDEKLGDSWRNGGEERTVELRRRSLALILDGLRNPSSVRSILLSSNVESRSNEFSVISC